MNEDKMADMSVPVSVSSSFSKLGLDDWLVEQCKSIGISRPSAIQHHCIPPILKGDDCIGCAKTGSGKTAAFALPILQRLSEDPYGIFAVILTPTRELAYQISEHFHVLGRPMGLKDCVVIGGVDIIDQGKALEMKPHVVIATPGRLADHLQSSSTVDLKSIRYLVLDEADRLLEGNFGPDLEVIFEALPEKRQTLLFSATITDTMYELRKIAMKKPFFWSSNAPVATVEQLDQRYLLVPAQVKDAYLVQMLKNYTEEDEDRSIIIFTGTCKSCQALSFTLKNLEFENVALHSLIRQRTRIASLAQFKSNRVRLMVATDVASRGLDIPTVQLIINHNVPPSPKDYVHRVGRTARAGRGGMAVTMVTQFDVKVVKNIEKHIKTKLTEFEMEEKDVLPILNDVAVAKSKAQMKLEELDFGEKRRINKRKQMILEGKDPEEEERKKRKFIKQQKKAARARREERKKQKAK